MNGLLRGSRPAGAGPIGMDLGGEFATRGVGSRYVAVAEYFVTDGAG